MNKDAFANITDIEELLLFYDSLINEGNIISLLNVKSTLKLSTSLSEKFLQYYSEKRKEKLTINYLIEGYNPNKKEYFSAIISESELQNLKDAENYTIKIYSIKSKHSRADTFLLWKQELNEFRRLCDKVDFKKDLFIPDVSDVILDDLKIRNKKIPIDEKNSNTLIKANTKNDTPIKIKKEKISDDETKENVLQTNKNNENNENNVSTPTLKKTTKNIKKIYDFAQINYTKKKTTYDPSEEENKKSTTTNDTSTNETIKTDEERYKNTDSIITEHIIDNDRNELKGKGDLVVATKVIKESENKSTPKKLFHSDSSSDENEVENEVENKEEHEKIKDKENKKRAVMEQVEEEPVRKMHRIKSVKETDIYFENGYLVTNEKEKCIHISETESPKKTVTMNSTIVVPTNKKRKSSQQTLLTNFFKKKS